VSDDLLGLLERGVKRPVSGPKAPGGRRSTARVSGAIERGPTTDYVVRESAVRSVGDSKTWLRSVLGEFAEVVDVHGFHGLHFDAVALCRDGRGECGVVGVRLE
jgi:hypothetical protein